MTLTIDISRIGAEYEERGYARLSDFELFNSMINSIQKPRLITGDFNTDSYALHAPLELMARYSLLEYVRPDARELARKQILAVAATYESLPAVPHVKPLSDRRALRNPPEELLAESIEQGNEDDADACAQWIAGNVPVQSVVQHIGRIALKRLGAAVHLPIYLGLLARLGPGAGSESRRFLPGFVRALTADKHLKLVGGFSRASKKISPKTTNLTTLMQNAKKIAKPAQSGIAPLVSASEKHIAGARRKTLQMVKPDEAFRDLFRMSARWMLQCDADLAKYGWSHAMTIPQGLWAMENFVENKQDCLDLASAVVFAYRKVYARKINQSWRPQRSTTERFVDALNRDDDAIGWAWYASPAQFREIQTTLASEASKRNDAHLVKYVLACLDLTAFDPAETRLYHAAATQLLMYWMRDTNEKTLLQNLGNNRF